MFVDELDMEDDMVFTIIDELMAHVELVLPDDTTKKTVEGSAEEVEELFSNWFHCWNLISGARLNMRMLP